MPFPSMGARRAPDEVPAAGTVPPVIPPPAVAPPAPPVVPPTPAPVVPPVVAPPVGAPVGAPGNTVELTTSAFNDRIAQAKRSAAADAQATLLKDLGVDSLDVAKARISAHKTAEEAGKTEAQRTADKIKELEPLANEAKAAKATFARIATGQMVQLSEAQQAAVKAVAGDDPARQLDVIEALRPTWAAATTPVPPPAGTPPGREPLPLPASTSAAGGSPPPANPGAVDHKAIYAELREKNPMLAAQYALRHEGAIYPSSGS